MDIGQGYARNHDDMIWWVNNWDSCTIVNFLRSMKYWFDKTRPIAAILHYFLCLYSLSDKFLSILYSQVNIITVVALHKNISKIAPAIHRSLSSSLEGQPSPHLIAPIVQHILSIYCTNPNLTYFNHFKYPNIDKFLL